MIIVPIIPRIITINSIKRGVINRKQEIEIINHIIEMEYNFDFAVIPFFILKSLIYEPTNRLEINLAYRRSELLRYNPAESNKNGVVGNPGMKTPTTPMQSVKVPKKINIGFIRPMNYCLFFRNFPII